MFSGGVGTEVLKALSPTVEDHIFNNGLDTAFGAEFAGFTTDRHGEQSTLYSFNPALCSAYSQAEAQRLVQLGMHGPLVEGLLGLSRFCLNALEMPQSEKQLRQTRLATIESVNTLASQAECEVAVEQLVLMDEAVCHEQTGILRNSDDVRKPEFLAEMAAKILDRSKFDVYEFELAAFYSAALMQADTDTDSGMIGMARNAAYVAVIDGLKKEAAEALQNENAVAVPQWLQELETILSFLDRHYDPSSPMRNELRGKVQSITLPLEAFLKTKNLKRAMYGFSSLRRSGEFQRNLAEVVKTLQDLDQTLAQAVQAKVNVPLGEQAELLRMASQYAQGGYVETAVQLVDQYFAVNGKRSTESETVAALGY